jgi:hypothetical protein
LGEKYILLRKILGFCISFGCYKFCCAKFIKFGVWRITNFSEEKFVIPRGGAIKVKTQRTVFAGFLFVQIRFKNGVFGGFGQTKNPSHRDGF